MGMKFDASLIQTMQILYLDSLEVDGPIPSTLPRAAIWNDDLITKVMKKDKKGPGVYGKLRVSSPLC